MPPRFLLGLARGVVPILLGALLAAGPVHAAGDGVRDAEWERLHQRSRDVLAPLLQELPPDAHRPRTVVVGFTGGLEGSNSGVSGVVRLRRTLDERFGDHPGVTALAYSNLKWRAAARDVAALAQGEAAMPLIVVYGHSWGAGAIGKFARELRREGLDIALAVYIDAFTLRNPRVPSNVHAAVNIFQRTGLLRGWPLRGKRMLVPESRDATVILGNLQVRPETEHFGWNWNLVQPLFYRHHHRIGHDVRIQQFLLDIVGLQTTARPAAVHGRTERPGSPDDRAAGKSSQDAVDAGTHRFLRSPPP